MRKPPQTAIVIGAGPVGCLTALTLAKRGLSVRLLDAKAGDVETFDLPYVCSQKVEDFLSIELPDLLRDLAAVSARRISIAEILRSRFSNPPVTARDEEVRFLCVSRSALRRLLLGAVAKAGLSIERSSVTGLIHEGNRVTGVSLASSSALADLVIDTSGPGRMRSKWIPNETFETYGPAYTSLAKFFTYSGDRKNVQFNLARGQSFRGGIYPLEGQRFAIALIVPENVVIDDEESFFDRALESVPGSTSLIAESKSDRSIQKIDGIRNRISNFYSDLSHEWQGFLPIGDSLMTGNPIYGRGLSLAVIQLAALLDGLTDDLLARTTAGFRESRKYWIDGAMADRGEETSSNMSSKALHLLREVFVATVVSQLPTNPELTRRFLYNYQLMLPAWRITSPRDYWTALSKLGEMSK